MARIRKGRNAKGFTLVELLVVLTIIAIVAALVSPYAKGSFQARRLQDAALTLCEHVKYAQSLAVDQARPTRLYVDHQEQRYRVEIAKDATGQDFVPAAGPAGQYMYLAAGITMGELELAAGAAKTEEFVFAPDEQWTVGQVQLTDGRASRIVKVSQGLGCVQVVSGN